MRDAVGCDRGDGSIDRPGKKDGKLNEFFGWLGKRMRDAVGCDRGDGWMDRARKEGLKTERCFGGLRENVHGAFGCETANEGITTTFGQGR